jgi:hypothetical protein
LDGARVTVDGTGAVELVTGGSAVGQKRVHTMSNFDALIRDLVIGNRILGPHRTSRRQMVLTVGERPRATV